MKKIGSLFIAASLSLSMMTATPSLSLAVENMDYVPLGDSIAAGQLYDGTFSAGYTGLIRAELNDRNMAGSFTNSYTASGQTSDQLLVKLQQADVQQSIREAELVTISIGANDFIQAMNQGGTISVSEGLALIKKVRNNVTSALQQIKALNPNADIYVFGYYFPLPYYEEGQTKNNLKSAFSLFNSNLKAAATNEGVHFVEIASVFDPNAFDYLPDPDDIHPNEAGYELMSDQFFKTWVPDLDGVWGKVWDKGVQPSGKEWTITLNQPVESASIAESLFIVKDGKTRIQVETDLSSDGKKMIVKAPVAGYAAGTYHLLLTSQLKDSSGHTLNTTVKMTFQVK